ncbi:transcriptional repressor LexA [Thermodesulfatator atlanticus]|uniref:transcriptional repressor LexA n=1 Tax=Thermodesulfatator atlanticus TaxID=501497 RepID=UPI0003B68A51|nr:transcriptional repressor LexA [Thermodesulfatator atlanticus]
MPKLSESEKIALEFIEEYLSKNGYPPSFREIAEACGFSSKSSVHKLLRRLEAKGFVELVPGEARGIRLLRPAKGIPVLGKIPAGEPLIPYEDLEEVVPIDPSFFGGGRLFMVRVRGDSMKDAGILPGDLVVIRPQEEAFSGDIVAALIYEPEPYVTLKRLKISQGRIELHPENPVYEPMIFSKEEVENGKLKILGVKVGLLRKG